MAESFEREIRRILHAGCPVVCCETFEEDRLAAAVAGIAAELGVPCRRWTLLGAGSAPPLEAVRRELAALLGEPGPAVLLASDVHHFLGDPVVQRAIRAFVAAAEPGRRLIVCAPAFRVPAELEHDVVVVALPLPDAERLAEVAGEALDGIGAARPAGGLDPIGDALRGLTEAEARWVVRKAAQDAGGTPGAAEIMRQKGWRFAQAEGLEIVTGDVPFERLGGLDELKRWLSERGGAFSRQARAYGLPPPRGLMLMGVQGCGKSLAAKAIASFWGLPLVRLDMGLIAGHEHPEASLRRAVRVAEAMAPVVLWVDEIEKGFAGAVGPDARRLLGGFVTWLQEKSDPVFVVATANEVEDLPPELPRKGRFDEIFFVDLPDAHERAEIFRIHLAARGRDPAAFDVEALARRADRFSGSEIEQAVLSALHVAFAGRREVATADVLGAIADTVPLATTFEDRIKALREWARVRARPATQDRRRLDLFRQHGSG